MPQAGARDTASRCPPFPLTHGGVTEGEKAKGIGATGTSGPGDANTDDGESGGVAVVGVLHAVRGVDGFSSCCMKQASDILAWVRVMVGL